MGAKSITELEERYATQVSAFLNPTFVTVATPAAAGGIDWRKWSWNGRANALKGEALEKKM